MNAGHRRGGKVLRCEGDSNQVRTFEVFGPVVLGGIRELPGTLHDRSIVIRMKRATREEIAGRSRFDSCRTAHETELCRKLARWGQDNLEPLRNAEPDMGQLHNRLADNWRPLFAIADVVGGDWPRLAREAMRGLFTTTDEAETAGVMLLADIRDIFVERGADRLTSAELVDALVSMEGRPWAEWGKGEKPITQNTVARLLKAFGIKPGTIRLPEEKTLKGYYRAKFEEDFRRYLPDPDVQTVTPSQTSNHAGFRDFRNVTREKEVTVEDRLKAAPDKDCDGVTDGNVAQADREALEL